MNDAGLKTVLSLGAGVQSSTVLRLAIKDVIERPDFVIFADTGWEPVEVYENLEILRKEMDAAGMELHVVTVGNIKEDSLKATVRGVVANGERHANLPFITIGPDGSIGRIRRQCTREYKVDPITKKIKALCEIQRKTKKNNIPLVEHWFGISIDEIRRCTLSRFWWSINYYPLIELEMSRDDCIQWNARNGYERPPRSACVGCPYKSDMEWRVMKMTDPVQFEEACEFDDVIRNRGGTRGQIFIHRSGTPLRDVDFSNEEDHGQLTMFSEECAGMCGV